MEFLKKFNWDLGISKLLPEWKEMLSWRYLAEDCSAGITVACIAIPLSLAIALASGVSPGVGLITSIISGIICALFGGTRLAVSGPAAAMTILIANNVEKFGVEGLIFIGLIAGIMQLITGVIGLGKLGRFVPLPVISGFTAGIGVIIIIGQLPRAFGLEPPDQSHVFAVFTHLQQYMHLFNLTSLLLVALTILIIRGLPRWFNKIPAALVAVVAVTVLVNVFSLPVPLIGSVPSSLPAPKLPSVPHFAWGELLTAAFMIYLLASLETLLSSSAVDKLAKAEKHNPDQEMIGQGLGNIAVSMFGGIPVTGVIARSAVNVVTGAKTRRSSIIHSLIILLSVFAISSLVSRIPIAALAGVLFSVAYSMINYREFRSLWRIARREALIYAVTFFTIIFVDLIAGVQIGIAAAALIVLLQAARANLHVSTFAKDETVRLSITGPLTFLSIVKIGELEKKLQEIPQAKKVIIDLTGVTHFDSSGATAIIELFNSCETRKAECYIKGLPKRFEEIMAGCGGEKILEKYYIISENQLKKKDENSKNASLHGRLIHGVQKFYSERKAEDRRLFEQIALQQDPHTLFITCSDSRIIPSLLTSTDPGELFIVRNVGNFIPPFISTEMSSEAAAIEFALNFLNISDIVVCGHSNCGAIKAVHNSDAIKLLPQLLGWVQKIKKQIHEHKHESLNEIAQMNVLNQLENLKQYPSVQKKLLQNALSLHAWFYDIEQNCISEWDEDQAIFIAITENESTNDTGEYIDHKLSTDPTMMDR
jgi:carbonic anhydrase